MIIKRTYLQEKNFYEPNKKNTYNKKVNKRYKKNFQQELFEAMETIEIPKTFKDDNLDIEFKRYFYGEIIRKDHLFTGNLTDTQKEVLIRISHNFY